jgi:hypothetical protein
VKIRKLYFFVRGRMTQSIDMTTHDIAIGGPGYIVTERRSGTSFLVHAATCTAELEKEGEAQPEVPTARAKKGAPPWRRERGLPVLRWAELPGRRRMSGPGCP